MILLVTGGAGFIGSNFIRHVLAERSSLKVINVDTLTYSGNPENLRDVEERDGGKRYFFVRGDICDADLLEAVFNGSHPLLDNSELRHSDFKAVHSRSPVGAVVHFAAESHVDRSIRDASAFFRTNVEGTRLLVETARRCWGVGPGVSGEGAQRFVHVSTDEVYGALQPDDPPFRETDPLRPSSPYAASKAAADLMVLAYVHTFGFPAIITRCGNNYGPYQHPEKFIPLFITNALEGRPLPLYGDGLQVRDWIHVLDHCGALLAILERGQIGEIYNIGARQERGNREVAELICRFVGKKTDAIRSIADRPGHDRRYALDAGKIQSVLGWKAQRSFTEALESTIRWYESHPGWWQRLKNAEFWRYYKEVYGGV